MALTNLRKHAFYLLFVLPLMASAQPLASGDLDRDGIPDQLEQALLEKFRPTFMISPLDCDGQPAEFRAGVKEAIVLDRNGTIYGQVFRPPVAGSDRAALELHYYHLWSKDCGKMGHPLDAEYVASLIQAEHAEDPTGNWNAVYWYAAAHEDTVCDTSSIARATTIDAQERGATVWVAAGKHGSYLNREGCEKGCRQDRCVNSIPLEAGNLINVGEVGAPLNGAEWTSSKKWHLAPKMGTVFTLEVTAIADRAGSDVVLARASRNQMQATIAAVGNTLDAAGLGPQHTSVALSTAKAKTRKALALSFSKVHSSLRKATEATAQWGER